MGNLEKCARSIASQYGYEIAIEQWGIVPVIVVRNEDHHWISHTWIEVLHIFVDERWSMKLGDIPDMKDVVVAKTV